MKTKVMVISGARAQIPIINRLHKYGFEVYDVNLYKDSPAFKYADHFGVMDILDKKTCFEFAKENHIDAVMSEMCDIATPTVAYIAERLNLPGIGSEMAELYTNKFAMREFGIKNGIPTPEYKICKTKEEAIEFFCGLGKKIVIKPLDSNSSRGVFTISCLEDIENHFDESLSYSHIKNAVLCERYITGTEFTVDGIVTKHGHVCLAISEKHHYDYNENIADQLFFSHHNINFDYDLLRETNNAFVDKSGLKYGLTHAEYKYEDGKFYLIEIGARGGGNYIGSTIVPLMSGVDNYEYIINKTIGKETNENLFVDNKLWDRCCVLKFFDVPNGGGVVKKIHGVDFLNDCKNVVDYDLNFSVGDVISPAKNDSARIGYYIAYADSDEQLRKLMKRIEKEFIIELEQ